MGGGLRRGLGGRGSRARVGLARACADRSPPTRMTATGPTWRGTSRLSPHLCGEVSGRQVWHADAGGLAEPPRRGGRRQPRRAEAHSRRAWRFGRAFVRPARLARGRIITCCRRLRTSQSSRSTRASRPSPGGTTQADLEAWQRGLTGYPLVDAGDATALGDRLDAQPRAAGRGVVPGQHLLLRWRTARTPSGTASSTPTSRTTPRLAVGRRVRRRSGAVLAHLQPGHAEPPLRPGRRLRAALGAGARASAGGPSAPPGWRRQGPARPTSRSARPTRRPSWITARPAPARSPPTMS